MLSEGTGMFDAGESWVPVLKDDCSEPTSAEIVAMKIDLEACNFSSWSGAIEAQASRIYS